MRSKILSVCVIAAMTLGGAAFAGTTSTKAATTMAATSVSASAGKDAQGTITKISAKGNYVVVGGWKYHLPKGFSLNGFKVGEKVSISYVLKGKHHDVTAMTAA